MQVRRKIWSETECCVEGQKLDVGGLAKIGMEGGGVEPPLRTEPWGAKAEGNQVAGRSRNREGLRVLSIADFLGGLPPF